MSPLVLLLSHVVSYFTTLRTVSAIETEDVTDRAEVCALWIHANTPKTSVPVDQISSENQERPRSGFMPTYFLNLAVRLVLMTCNQEEIM